MVVFPLPAAPLMSREPGWLSERMVNCSPDGRTGGRIRMAHSYGRKPLPMLTCPQNPARHRRLQLEAGRSHFNSSLYTLTPPPSL